MVKEAIGYSAPEKYVRPFASRSVMISPVLIEFVLKDGLEADPTYLSTLFAACGICYDNSPGLDTASRLTSRETEILELLVAGYKYREIATRLFVSYETVKSHIQHIYEKLKVTSRAEAIKTARQAGLLARLPGR
jgi:DNA-binding NarL/FixJ family response regulator